MYGLAVGEVNCVEGELGNVFAVDMDLVVTDEVEEVGVEGKDSCMRAIPMRLQSAHGAFQRQANFEIYANLTHHRGLCSGSKTRILSSFLYPQSSAVVR